jgi:hypothetical protein
VLAALAFSVVCLAASGWGISSSMGWDTSYFRAVVLGILPLIPLFLVTERGRNKAAPLIPDRGFKVGAVPSGEFPKRTPHVPEMKV